MAVENQVLNTHSEFVNLMEFFVFVFLGVPPAAWQGSGCFGLRARSGPALAAAL
ncbi:MAG: hypothetical protein N2110_08425 [Flavobacteriales bacterium]|nr:hypothetical protein [Flavobacteriales bacterium]